MKKLFFLTALLCASVMGFAYTAAPYEGEPDASHWIGTTDATYASQFQWTTINEVATPSDVVNIQLPGFSGQIGIYVTFPGADFNAVYYDGVEVTKDTEYAQQGAGLCFYVSSFEKQYTEILLKNGETVKYGLKVYNKKGKEVWEIYDTNFALASNGSSATASSGNAAEAIDGNTGTRWESVHKQEKDEDQNPIPENIAWNNNQTWTLDMGQLRIYNIIQIVWEGAYGKTFNIKSSKDGENWKTVKHVENQVLSDFPYEQALDLAENDTARYIQFEGIARGTQYGYSFWEFRVSLPSVPVVTTISLNSVASYTQVNSGVALTAQVKDQFKRDMVATLTYEITPADAGTITDGVFTPSKVGAATIIAKHDEVESNAVVICGVTSTNSIAQEKTVVAGYTPGNAAEHPSKVVDGNNGTQWTTWQNRPTSEEWLYIDLEKRYSIEAIEVVWGADISTNYILQVRTIVPSAEDAANDEAWTTIATVTDATANSSICVAPDNADDVEKVRYVRFHSLTRKNVDLIRLNEIRVFGTEWADEGDKKAPVMGTVSEYEAGRTGQSIMLNVTATDEDGEVVGYNVTDGDAITQNNISPDGNGRITITDLSPETQYTFTIYAVDGAKHVSENSVNITVTTGIDTTVPQAAAPVPSGTGKEVRPIYSDAFASILAHPFDKDGFAGVVLMMEKDIDGDNCLVYNINGSNEVTWGMYDNGDRAIIAQEEYRADGKMGIDASAMEKLHIDIWSLQAINNAINININDAALTSLRLSHSGEGWQSYDIDLSEFAEGEEGKKIDNVRWMKFNGIGPITGKMALDNVYFWKDNGSGTAISNTEAEVKAVKMIENGQLIIIKNGVKYNVAGQQVK